MKEPLVYGTDDDAVRREMDQEVLQIEALPFVRSLYQLGAVANKGGGFQASLWCHAGRETQGSCGKKQEPPVHTTHNAALRISMPWAFLAFDANAQHSTCITIHNANDAAWEHCI